MGERRAEHVSERFARLLSLYRKSDGSEWGGSDLEKATNGVVTRSHVSTLKRGNIDNPGILKLEAITEAMGFAPELWFGGGSGSGKAVVKRSHARSRTRRFRRCRRRP